MYEVIFDKIRWMYLGYLWLLVSKLEGFLMLVEFGLK